MADTVAAEKPTPPNTSNGDPKQQSRRRRRPRKPIQTKSQNSNEASLEIQNKPAKEAQPVRTDNESTFKDNKSAEGAASETTADSRPAPKNSNRRRNQRFQKKLTQRRKEIDELKEKYKVFAIDPEILRILFQPSDPDFPFPMPFVEIDVHVSRHYPNQGPEPFIIVNNEDIPRGNGINIENAFTSLAYKGKTLAEKVDKLDKDLEELLTMPPARTFTIVKGKKSAPARSLKEEEAKTNEKKEFQAQEELEAERKAQEEAQRKSEAESSSDTDFDSGSDSDSNSDSDSGTDYEPEYMHSSDEEDIDAGVSNSARDTDKPKREGTELVFHDIKLTNIALCEIVSLNLLFQCGRCKTLHTFNNVQSAEYGKPSKPRAEICSKCDLPLMVAFRKEYLHSMCHIAGYIDVDGGKVADLLPSSYSAMCGQCQTTSPIFKNVDMGAQRMVNCRHCHAKLWIQLELFEFVLLSTETLAPAAKKVEREKLPASAPKQKLHLTGGEPLPNYGICEHYRKSLRWFRFGCCQRVFPCDRCHDAEMHHPSDLATRMLCGYCSREQRFSSKCLYCEHDYTQRITRFWEGGKGVRDRKLMSRKDKRKYKRDPVAKKKNETHFKGKSKGAPK